MALALIAAILAPLLPAQQQSGTLYRFKVETDVVLVNVVVRDKNGEIVRGLKKEDFTLLEDGKQQHVASFDFEQTETQAGPQPAPRPGEPPSRAISGRLHHGSRTRPRGNAARRRLRLVAAGLPACGHPGRLCDVPAGSSPGRT